MNDSTSTNQSGPAPSPDALRKGKRRRRAKRYVPIAAKILLSADDACQALSISDRTLTYLVKNGELIPVKMGRRNLFDVVELRAYVEKLKQRQRAGVRIAPLEADCRERTICPS